MYQWKNTINPANIRCSPIVVLILVQCRRQWTNIKPTMGECLVFSGNGHYKVTQKYTLRTGQEGLQTLVLTSLISDHLALPCQHNKRQSGLKQPI